MISYNRMIDCLSSKPLFARRLSWEGVRSITMAGSQLVAMFFSRAVRSRWIKDDVPPNTLVEYSMLAHGLVRFRPSRDAWMSEDWEIGKFGLVKHRFMPVPCWEDGYENEHFMDIDGVTIEYKGSFTDLKVEV